MQGQTDESSAHVLYIAIHRRRAFVREIIFALGELRKTDLRFLLYLGKYSTHLSQQTDGRTDIHLQTAGENCAVRPFLPEYHAFCLLLFVLLEWRAMWFLFTFLRGLFLDVLGCLGVLVLPNRILNVNVLLYLFR